LLKLLFILSSKKAEFAQRMMLMMMVREREREKKESK